MKSLPALVAVSVLAACGHLTATHSLRSETLSEEGTLVFLRYAPQDAEVALQAQEALHTALPAAARWGALPSRLTVTIHPTHDALEAAARRRGHPWLRAWSRGDSVELQSPRTWPRGGVSDAELAQLLAHELTHCALYQALGNDAHRARSVPLWFWEGMATTNADERFPAVRWSRMDGEPLAQTAALHRADSPMVYATADEAFRFLVRRFGEPQIHAVIARVRDGADFAAAFRDVLGITVQTFEREFQDDIDQERNRG